MKNTDIHEVIITKEGLDVIAADTEFYSFIGERLYDTFDRLICEEDRGLFQRRLSCRRGGEFLLRMLREDGGEEQFFAAIKDGTAENNFVIRLSAAEKIVESERRLKRAAAVTNKLLELYGDRYFEYSPADDFIRIYAAQRAGQSEARLPLAQFERQLMSRVPAEKGGDVARFIKDIRDGAQRCELQVEKMTEKDGSQNLGIVLLAAPLYDEEGEMDAVAGYIHMGGKERVNTARSMEKDALTGVLIKRDITNAAIDMIDIKKTEQITLAIIDIDYFKKVNDEYGHMRGDEVLRSVARMIDREVGESGLVGRFGGDEFLVIFYQAGDMESMRERLRSIKNIVHAHYPPGVENRPAVTLSIGCAAYPKDAGNYEDLFVLADFALYRAKEKGRDRYIIYNEKLHGTIDEIRNMKMEKKRIDTRGDMSKGDILCVMMNQVYGAKKYPLEKLLDDAVENFGIQRILVYGGEGCRICCMAGEKRLSGELIGETEGYVRDAEYEKCFDAEGIFILNDVKRLQNRLAKTYEALCRQGVCSCVQLRFLDKCGRPGILSLEAIDRRVVWNQSCIHYYRLLARLFLEYEVGGREEHREQ